MQLILRHEGTEAVLSDEPWRRGVHRLIHPGGRSVELLSPALSGHHFFTGECLPGPDAKDYEPHTSPGTLRALSDGAAVWHQPPTPATGVETQVAYEIVGAGCLEASFETRSHAARYPLDYVGLFWATIVPHGGQRGFHLLLPDVAGPGGRVRWAYRGGGGDCWTCRANTFLAPNVSPAARSADHPPTYYFAEASERFALPLYVVRWGDLYYSLEVDSADVAFTNVLMATAVGGPSHDVWWRLRPGERRLLRIRMTVGPWIGWSAVEERYRAWDGCVDPSFTVADRAGGVEAPRLSPWVKESARERDLASGGLALSRRLFETRGRALLEEVGLTQRCAVVCLGGTSQNAGLDDEGSRDHWWGPYLTFLLPDDASEDDRGRLTRAVAAMPDEVDGVRWVGYGGQSPRRSGVNTFLPFLRSLTGLEARPRDAGQWLPHLTRASFLGRRWTERLFDATQGEVFHDPGRRFTELWRHWTGYVPPEVHRALLARSLFRVWNASPEYNLARLLRYRSGDRLSFQLCLARFVDDVLELAFCWNERFVPHAKWRAAHFRRLPIRPAGAVSGVETLFDLPDAEAQLEAASAMVKEIKRLMADLYHIVTPPQRPLSAYAHAVRAMIGDPEVKRVASLDW